MKTNKLKTITAQFLELLVKMHSFWLFDKNAGELSKGKKIVYYVYNYALVVLSGIVIGISSLLLATGTSYPREVFFGYFANPYLLLLNLLPPVLIILLFYGITGRGWISCLISGVVTLLPTLGNYYLLKFRDDTLIFSDVLLTKEAIKISVREKYDYTPGARIIFVFALLLVMSLLLFLFQRHKQGLVVRLCLLVVPVVCIFPLKGMYSSEEIYQNKTRNEEHINKYNPTEFYVSKGFVYPFLNSIRYSLNTKPYGYDEEKTENNLAKYEDADIPDNKKITVIGLMLEAYVDLENKGIDGIDESVYTCYRTVRDENYSGILVTNIFGGSTIESERAFLTGDYILENYRHSTDSYVRYFNGQGYYTDGGHPSEGWFYNRRYVNEYLGFNEYRLKENYFWDVYGGEEMRLDSNFITNDIFYNYQMAKEDGNMPYFSFNVSYQGHAPYESAFYEWGTDQYFDKEGVSQSSKYILRNYLGSQKDTGWRLMELVNKIKAEEEPIVLVVFGDHMPWLGDGNAVYNELGVNLDVSTKEGFMNYYSTEYIMVANDAAKQLTGNDFVGEGPVTSPCFLMNLLFEQLGWDGPSYMQYTDSVREKIAAINDVGIIDSDGNFVLHSRMDEETRSAVYEYMYAQYYRKHSFDK